MADFNVNMTGTVQVDDSIKVDYESDFIIEYGQNNIVDQFVEFDRQIGASALSFPRYSLLSLATTPLTERAQAEAEAMADSEILITPEEYGNVITSTKLADLQTGGRSSRAAVALVGQNMGQTRNALATQALEATTNAIIPGAGTEAGLLAGDVMTGAVLNKVYNKMARANVPTIGGLYIAFMHDDVIHDLREAAAAGSWQEVSKYNNEQPVLANEVGIYKGFRIMRNNHATVGADAGASAVDSYTSTFLGANGLGLAESMMPSLVVTGPFDNLNRFVNVGWYGVFNYKIIESAAVYKALTASSVGDNA